MAEQTVIYMMYILHF